LQFLSAVLLWCGKRLFITVLCGKLPKQKETRKDSENLCGMINKYIDHGTTRIAMFTIGEHCRLMGFCQTPDL
jgi:hypothetical protein